MRVRSSCHAEVDVHWKRFGGREHSELLDPGEWLLVVDALLDDASDRLDQLPEHRRRELRDQFHVAADAVQEVLKFIPPWADAVPQWAFWSRAGHRLHLTRRMAIRAELAGVPLGRLPRIAGRDRG